MADNFIIEEMNLLIAQRADVVLKLNNTRKKLLEMREHSYKGNMTNLEKQLKKHEKDLKKYNDRISKISHDMVEVNKDLANISVEIGNLDFMVNLREKQPRDIRSNLFKSLSKIWGNGEDIYPTEEKG